MYVSGHQTMMILPWDVKLDIKQPSSRDPSTHSNLSSLLSVKYIKK